MRLTCPNCSARYEVADSMVPPEGRDVQCSNCSTTWFQPGRRVEQRPTAAVSRSPRAAEITTETETETTTKTEAAAAPPPSPTEPAPAPEPASEAASAQVPEPQPPEDQPRRRTLDPDLRSILEQEAAREALLRRAEADPVETQDELSLGQEPEDAHRARRRAELEAAPDAFETGGKTGLSPALAARDLFPDIDEINSTLRDTGDRSGSEADASDIDTLDTMPRRRRGTRIGFLLVLALAAAGMALYTKAPNLAAAAPALAPALDGYVTAVNGARFWLDDLAQGLAGATPEG